MIDAIVGVGSQIVWFILLLLGGLLAAWGYGKKKKSEGKAAEREKARIAREAAAKEAKAIREDTAAKTVEQKRKDVSKWEK